ncbi:MAG: FOG: PKD repeat, partial [uncultured Acidimicrobiales bacterium]
PDTARQPGRPRPVRRQRRQEPGQARGRRARAGPRAGLPQPVRRRPDPGRDVLDRQRRQRLLGRRPGRRGHRGVHQRPGRGRPDDPRQPPRDHGSGLLRRAPEPDARQPGEHLRRPVGDVQGQRDRVRPPLRRRRDRQDPAQRQPGGLQELHERPGRVHRLELRGRDEGQPRRRVAGQHHPAPGHHRPVERVEPHHDRVGVV